MPFDASDPRAALAQAAPSPPAELAEPQVIPFTDDTAEISDLGSRLWLLRTQHAVVAYAQAAAGERWVGPEDRETLLVVPDGPARVRIHVDGDGDAVVVVAGGSVVIIPETSSTVEVLDDGVVVRIVPAAGSELLDRCINAAAYAQDAANVAPFAPAHPDLSLLRYSLNDYPPTEGRFGQIFRTANLMVNFIATRHGPRDPRRLSPHSHADFEQCSLQLSGEFVHHVRSPWTPDMSKWRTDQHLRLVGAGAVIFPPPLEHTSQAVGPGANRLIDVFAPPRGDFMAMDGWVLNAQDYE
jgi:hypothetical protein